MSGEQRPGPLGLQYNPVVLHFGTLSRSASRWAGCLGATPQPSAFACVPMRGPQPRRVGIIIRRESCGPLVKRLQLFLNDRLRLVPALAADGCLGTKTLDAVRNFQKSRSISPEGVVGRTTWWELIKTGSRHKLSPTDILGWPIGRKCEEVVRKLSGKLPLHLRSQRCAVLSDRFLGASLAGLAAEYFGSRGSSAPGDLSALSEPVAVALLNAIQTAALAVAEPELDEAAAHLARAFETGGAKVGVVLLPFSQGACGCDSQPGESAPPMTGGPAPAGSGTRLADDDGHAGAARKPGELNNGGGHTFSRGTTAEDLAYANRPVTPAELTAAEPPSGPDEYAKRELALRTGMDMLRQAEEGAPPVFVDLSKTVVREPWDGQYNTTGESEWMKGVREDKQEIVDRIRTTGGHKWGTMNDEDLLMRRIWQIEIYEDAYRRGRRAGLSNLAAHAYAQADLEHWKDTSREQFEQMFATHFAQIAQALSGDPLGNLNKAIEQIGSLVEEASANVQKARALARAMEKQRAAAQAAKEVEEVAEGESIVGAAKSGGKIPDPEGVYRTSQGIREQIKDVNYSESGANCVSCAAATDSCLAGKPLEAFPDFEGLNIRQAIDFLTTRFKAVARYMGKGEDAVKNITKTIEEMGEGSRGIVIVTKGKDAHAFNVVMRNGKVFFPDGQKPGFFPRTGWEKYDDALFFPTTGAR